MRFAKLALLAVLALGLLAACATQPGAPAGNELPGFLLGLVHGFISPFALIVQFLPKLGIHGFPGVRIYAFPNDGIWYDLGFMLGVAMIMGGGGRAL